MLSYLKADIDQEKIHYYLSNPNGVSTDRVLCKSQRQDEVETPRLVRRAGSSEEGTCQWNEE